MRALAAPLLALLLSNVAEAARTPPCQGHPEIAGRCRTVHGRFSFANGNPSKRIWIVGTHRMLGISERPGRGSEGIESLPVNLRVAIGGHGFGTEVYADFEVCPFERQRPGWMQLVCVASARNLVVRRFPS